MKNGLPVISFENQRYLLVLGKIRKGDQLQIEGFVTLYKVEAVVNKTALVVAFRLIT